MAQQDGAYEVMSDEIMSAAPFAIGQESAWHMAWMGCERMIMTQSGCQRLTRLETGARLLGAQM